MRNEHNSGPDNGLQDTAVSSQQSENTDSKPQTPRNPQPEPDGHACPFSRNSKARCLAWEGSQRPSELKPQERCAVSDFQKKTPQPELPDALRCFAYHHNWHAPGPFTNRIKLRLAFKKPIRSAVNELLARGRDGLAEQIKVDFSKLQEKTRNLDRMCGGRQIDEDDELATLEHTKAHLAESLNDLAAMLDGGVPHRHGGLKYLTGTGEQTNKNNDAVAGLEKTTDGPWMTFRETAKLLGRSKSTVSKWAKKGRFSDNGLQGQKRRLSKASVLLVKRDIEERDRKKDDDEWHDKYAP